MLFHVLLGYIIAYLVTSGIPFVTGKLGGNLPYLERHYTGTVTLLLGLT